MDARSLRGTAGGAVFVTLTLLGWSSVPLFLKYFTGYIDAWTANGWRYGLSALFWSPVIIAGVSRGMLPGRIWLAALVPSVVNCAGQCCFAWTPYYIDPGLLTFILRFQIIFIAVGAFLLFPTERRILRSRSYWCAVLVVFGGSLGTCLLGTELPRGATAFGIVLAILAGLFFAGYSLSVRYFMHDIRPVTAFAIISTYTAAGLVAIMAVVGERRGFAVTSFTEFQWSMLVTSAFVGIAFAHVFYYASIARLGVAVSAGVIMLQPFITGVASYFLFEERLTAAQWASGVAAVGGAVVMLRVHQRLASSVATETAGNGSRRRALHKDHEVETG
jgi:drug/metabolite transporter (DMT)-like permease